MKFKFEDLEPEQKNYFVRELLKYDSLKNRESRIRIIEALISPIPNEVEREGKPRNLVFSILKECDKHDRGFLSFLKAIKEEEEQEGIYDELIIVSQKLLVIKEIYVLFEGSSKSSILYDSKRIEELYKSSLPVNERNRSENKLQEGTVTMAIDYLSGFSRETNSDETFPLLTFIKLFTLGEEESGDLSVSLIKSVKQIVKKLLSLYMALSPDDISHIENFNFWPNSREDRKPQSDSLDLLIQIKIEESRNKSKSSNSKKYSISFYEWRSSENHPLRFEQDRSKVPDQKLQAEIITVLEQYLKNSADLEPKIHFFFPSTLMCWDVDQWPYDSGEKPIPVLSDNNYVLLRALPNNPEKHKRRVEARRSSNQLKCLPIERKEGLSPRLKREEDANLIFFTFPLNHQHTDLLDIVSSSEIAIPIAIWIRESSDPIVFCDEKQQVLIQDLEQVKDMDDIPKKVRDLRLKAREVEEENNGKKKDFGSHISLLFEDPRRFIPIVPAVTPQASSSQLRAS
jgi:hypothetical protein